jgi:hypothetical protein
MTFSDLIDEGGPAYCHLVASKIFFDEIEFGVVWKGFARANSVQPSICIHTGSANDCQNCVFVDAVHSMDQSFLLLKIVLYNT